LKGGVNVRLGLGEKLASLGVMPRSRRWNGFSATIRQPRSKLEVLDYRRQPSPSAAPSFVRFGPKADIQVSPKEKPRDIVRGLCYFTRLNRNDS
jgi:hypothetical protein